MTDKPRLIEHTFPLKQASLREISRKAPCPCGSGRKYKKCCMPQVERGMPAGADNSADFVDPAQMGKGPMARMTDFAKPLIDAAGNDPKAVENAFSFGMIFWNLAVAGKEFVVEELPKVESAMCKSDKDRRHFRAMARIMFERYQGMRPGSGADLVPALEEIWGKDFSAGIGVTGWVGRIANAARSRFAAGSEG
ncbi:MAG: hypothetical protein A3G41_08045 [Elusimicrobia bacterium RIFCSPLOWO2_12_FULL_59_9]|nr:MAG: hypothetical protein A3G41_08045 [Elusimicrobia bacterium RIFCSPLOWO2_12_FULL_59_9]